MSVFISFLLFFLPTVVWYTFFLKGMLLKVKSDILRFSLAWFIGQYLSTLIIFTCSIILSPYVISVLVKTTIIYLLLLSVFFVFLLKNSHSLLLSNLKSVGQKHNSLYTGILLFFCLIFSFLLFLPHLKYSDNKIYSSPVYWDFNIHYPVIQSFVYGDNFPPENESFSGLPMTYHYPFYILTAAYASTGLGLVNAINLVSVMIFFFMLLVIIGLCEEVFKNRFIGFIAVSLTLTSSSLRFIDYLLSSKSINPMDIFNGIITNNSHPYFFSFVKDNPFGYNGTMFNLFYFIAERHLIFTVSYIIFCLVAMYQRKYLTTIGSIIVGILMGLFFQWNLATTIMIGGCLSLLFIIAPNRKKTFLILLPFTIMFLAQVIHIKSIINSEWFYPEVSKYPKINFEFPTMPNSYPLSFSNALGYYFYAYGLKIFFFFSGLALLFIKKRDIFYIVISLTLPTFIIINTLQFFPLSIWDNHKFIRPMNIIIDTVAAYVLFLLFIKRGKIIKIFSIFAFILLTLSGLIEAFPFLNTEPNVGYSQYPTDLINKVRLYSHPKSVFISSSTKELHLAGRVVFLGDSDDEPGAISVVDAAQLDRQKRKSIMENIYNINDLKNFCGLIMKNHINHITFNNQEKEYTIYGKLAGFPQFTGINENGQYIAFIRLDRCKNIVAEQ